MRLFRRFKHPFSRAVRGLPRRHDRRGNKSMSQPIDKLTDQASGEEGDALAAHLKRGAKLAGPKLAVEQILTLFSYSHWARDKLLQVIHTLDESRLKEAEHNGVYGSIHDTLAHMAVSEWLWIRRCQGNSPQDLPKGVDFPKLDDLIEWWDLHHGGAMMYISTLVDSDLQQEITYTAPDGKTRTRKIWHMLLQVPNHQTEHRSQIATMLGQMGVEVLPTDLVVYLSELTT